MSSRWLSTFSVLGILLIGLGIVGFVHPHFVYDPGQVPDGHEPWYYLVVGILMLVNGLFSPAPAKPPQKTDAALRAPAAASVTAADAEHPTS